MAMRSADHENNSPLRKVGTSDAATQVAANMRYGMMRNSHEALSASTTSLRMSRARSRYGWISGGPCRRSNRAFTLRTKPVKSGASSSTSSICAP